MLSQRVLSKLESPDTVIVRPATATMTVDEFLHRAIASAASSTVVADNSAPSYYLEYLQLEQYLPSLQEDASVPMFAQFLRSTHHNVWVGAGAPRRVNAAGTEAMHSRNLSTGTVGKLHFDPYVVPHCPAHTKEACVHWYCGLAKASRECN